MPSVTATSPNGPGRRSKSHFVTPGGRIVSDSPTAYALSITFNLVTDTVKRAALGERLAELVRENGYRIGTGFIGTPVLLDALLATGHVHTASSLLLQTRSPSWLYPVTKGATTIWERWDSLLPDGSVNPGEMTPLTITRSAESRTLCTAGSPALLPVHRGIRS